MDPGFRSGSGLDKFMDSDPARPERLDLDRIQSVSDRIRNPVFEWACALLREIFKSIFTKIFTFLIYEMLCSFEHSTYPI